MEVIGSVGRWLAVAAALSLPGCAPSGPTALAPPSPMSAPAIEVQHATLGDLAATPHLSPPDDDEVVDELLASPVLRDPDFRAAVDEWVEYWSRTAAPWFPDFVRRMGHFRPTVDQALQQNGLPASLLYLPLIESGYSPSARSHAAAVGLWQFMEGTAAGYGMRVTPLIDERRDPYKSTAAAADFLATLHDEFGSWFLTLAAYNSGPTRTRRIVRRHAPLAQRSDSLFWALRHHFPPETRNFLPKLIGAVIVATDPAGHGYEAARPDPPLVFDEVEVPDATTLDVVARAAEASEDEIERLNPELLRGITPPGQPFTLRVPSGSAGVFRANYALIPPSERVTFVEHVVTSGETLSHIARRYGVRVSDIEAANPAVRARFLKIGARLTVPVAPSVRRMGSDR